MESMKPDYNEQSDAVIGKYGIMGTPALVINKKIVSVGTTPEKRKIRQWLEEATL